MVSKVFESGKKSEVGAKFEFILIRADAARIALLGSVGSNSCYALARPLGKLGGLEPACVHALASKQNHDEAAPFGLNGCREARTSRIGDTGLDTGHALTILEEKSVRVFPSISPLVGMGLT